MAIMGFNFSEISVKRKEGPGGKINIKNNVLVKDVKDHDLSLGDKKQSALKFTFEYTSKYGDDLGEILLGGNLLFVEASAKAKSILDEWKKNKKVSKEVMTQVLNTVLSKCSVQALILSERVNLPPPFLLPSVKEENEKK